MWLVVLHVPRQNMSFIPDGSVCQNIPFLTGYEMCQSLNVWLLVCFEGLKGSLFNCSMIQQTIVFSNIYKAMNTLPLKVDRTFGLIRNPLANK